MKTGLTLVDLAKRIEENRQLKADYVAPAQDVRAATTGTKGDLSLVIPNPQGGQGLEIPGVRPVAHDQIGTFLGVPSRYYDRMLHEAPELLCDNLNTWFSRSPDRRMIRTLAGDARAFVSDRYQRIENEEIANVVLPVLLEAGVTIRSCEVTERRMYINASLPGLQAEVKVGDIVEAGVAISNSEIGLGACSIQALVLRLVCLNGLKVPAGRLQARHVGRRVQEGDDLNAIFADDTRRADDRAIMLKVRDTVRHALSEAAFTAAVSRMRDLTEARLDKAANPVKAVELLAAKVGATEAEQGGILQALIRGGDLTAWGMVNAVTFQAHDAPDYDRAMDFVDAGGRLLALPPPEWKTILQAA